MHPRGTSQPKELHYNGLENSEKTIIFHHLVLQEKPCPCVAVGPGYFLLFATQTKSLYKLTGQYQVKNYKNSEINGTLHGWIFHMCPRNLWHWQREVALRSNFFCSCSTTASISQLATI